MNKKIAIILTFILTLTTTLFGCGNAAKTDSSSSQEASAEVNTAGDKADNNTADNAENTNTTGQPVTYTAKAGYTFIIPASWEGKYEISERPSGLAVYYKCSKDKTSYNPWLFSIDSIHENIHEEHYDTVGDIRKFKIGDEEFLVGGPTGLAMDPESEDYADFESVRKQIAEVVNSIKVIE